MADTREKVLSQMIGNGLANWHYSGKKIDDEQENFVFHVSSLRDDF